MHSRILSTTILIATYAVSTGVSAHIGIDIGSHHEIGFMDGLLHPMTGLDHMAALLAVGFWGALTARRWWTTPLAFAAMLLGGALLGLAGLAFPVVEPMIAASLLVLGLLVAVRARMPVLAGAALVGVFAIFHGVAHGTELAGAAQIGALLAGMLITTVALHGLGVALGLAVRQRSAWWPRVAGVAVGLLGGLMLVQLV